MRENARQAASWVITVTVLVVFALTLIAAKRISHYVVAGGAGGQPTPLFLVGNVLVWAVWIGHLVVSIIGLAIARTQVMRSRIAIPFIPSFRS